MKVVVIKRTIGRVFFLPSAVLTVAGVLLFIAILSGEKPLADAQVVNFYANECAGGWEGATFAALEPQVTSETSLDYSKENSAYLENRLSPITCGQFTGTLPPETYHTRVMARFSWTQIPPEPPETDLESPAVSASSETSVASSTSTTTESTGVGETSSLDQSTTTADSGSAIKVGTTTSEAVSSSTSLSPSATTTVLLPDEGTTSSPPVSTETISTTSAETVLEATTQEPAPTTAESSGTGTSPEPSTSPEPEPVAPAAATAPDVISWWPFAWTAYAEAEELATSTIEGVSSASTQLTTSETLSIDMATDTTTTTVVATTTTATDTPATTSSETVTGGEGAQFVVQYTLDGVVWQVLGYVTTIDADVRLEFPKDILPTLGDISRVQLSITPLLHIDTMPPVYLDAVWLEVSYAPLGELGVHGISDIVPSITPFASLISDAVATSSVDATTTVPLVTTAEFIQGITAVYGIDAQYVLVTLALGTTTKELWLFDMKKYLVHRIGKDAAEIGTVPPSAKDGMIFWLNSLGDTLYTYDLRTAGSLHEMILVGNLPTGTEYTLTFPFTAWEVLWRGDAFYYRARKTGEVFQDENTDSVRTFLAYFDMVKTLPYERIQAISGTVIPEEESTFTSSSTQMSATTTEAVTESLSTSTIENVSTSLSDPTL